MNDHSYISGIERASDRMYFYTFCVYLCILNVYTHNLNVYTHNLIVITLPTLQSAALLVPALDPCCKLIAYIKIQLAAFIH